MNRARIYIYGAGFVGLYFCDLLKGHNIFPLGFLDRSETLWGRQWDGVQIINPAYADRSVPVVICHSDIAICRQIVDTLLSDEFIEVRTIYEYAQLSEMKVIFQNQRNIFKVDLDEILQNETKIKEVVTCILTDEASKRTYFQVIEALKKMSFSGIDHHPIRNQYFPIDIFRRREDECFIDVGAGPEYEVLEEFLKLYGDSFSSYYLVEPCAYGNRVLNTNKKIKLINAVAGDIDNSWIGIRNYMEKNALVGLEGNQISLTFTIDNASWAKDVTFLKLDVEGWERRCLNGSWKRIKRNRPVLAVATYHNVSDYWEIPIMLNNKLDNYLFYLRSYQGVSETILYAIPAERRIMPD